MSDHILTDDELSQITRQYDATGSMYRDIFTLAESHEALSAKVTYLEAALREMVPVGYVVLSDHINRSTGQRCLDLNWDGELHPTRELAEGSYKDGDDWNDSGWVHIGVVLASREELPEWWSPLPQENTEGETR